MFARLFLALTLLGSMSCASAMPQSSAELTCRETDTWVSATSMGAPDVYRAPHVEGVQRVITFKGGTNPAAGKKIVKIKPSYSAALLDDGSAFHFIRDHDRDGAILGVRHVQSAACWSHRFNFNQGYRQDGPHEIILAEYEPGRGRELLRLENHNGHGRVSRVVQFPEKPFGENEEVLLLLESKHHFHGFGVSVPSTHGGWRSLMTITQETSGSLIVGSYAYTIRNGGLYSKPFP